MGAIDDEGKSKEAWRFGSPLENGQFFGRRCDLVLALLHVITYFLFLLRYYVFFIFECFCSMQQDPNAVNS